MTIAKYSTDIFYFCCDGDHEPRRSRIDFPTIFDLNPPSSAPDDGLTDDVGFSREEGADRRNRER